MPLKLLISGDRAHFTTLAFDPNKQKLKTVAHYPAPYNVSWVEPMSLQGHVDRLVGLSEGEESGLLFTFEIDHKLRQCRMTSQEPTLGAPAHFTMLYDRSALALATYLGGTVGLYPLSCNEEGEFLLESVPRTEVFPSFPYTSTGHGPIRNRQKQCHIHQILEDRRGILYAPDLGSDRVWILRRNPSHLEVSGWLQCPPGTGARHAVLTPNEDMMYVIGELSHTVLAFDLLASPAESIQPIDGFAPNIIPPSVHPNHHALMDSAELCLHPKIPNVLYATNRWEKHIERTSHLANVPNERPSGDAVAIILLSDDGMKVVETKFVRTRLDTIRGMRIHHDGSYVVLAGQEGGGIEIYSITGTRGDSWTLVADLNKGLEDGIKHAIWL